VVMPSAAVSDLSKRLKVPLAAINLKLLQLNGAKYYTQFVEIAIADAKARPAIVERKFNTRQEEEGSAYNPPDDEEYYKWKWGDYSRREQQMFLEVCRGRNPEESGLGTTMGPNVPAVASFATTSGETNVAITVATQTRVSHTRRSGVGCRQRRTIRRLKQWYYTRGLDWILRTHYDSITDLERIIFESWLGVEEPDDLRRLLSRSD